MANMHTAKVVLITGAARRIGAAMATHFHRQGYALIIHYHRSAAEALTLQQTLNAARADSAHLLQADLGDSTQIATLAASALAWRGHIDVLVNNASRFYPTPLGQVTRECWDDLLDSNLRGGFFLAQALAPALRQRRGCIINLSDFHADGGLKEYPVYSIAKAGVSMLTKALARELAPQVRVNGIAPGAILWPEHEASTQDSATLQKKLHGIALGRMGAPQDIAAAALFLVEQASYMTGQTIHVDGGRSIDNSLLS